MTTKITLDDLALMIKKGFDEIHETFATKKDLERYATKEDMLAGFRRMDQRFDALEDRQRTSEKEAEAAISSR